MAYRIFKGCIRLKHDNSVVALESRQSQGFRSNVGERENQNSMSALVENIFWRWFKHEAANLRFKRHFYTLVFRPRKFEYEFIEASSFASAFPYRELPRNLCRDPGTFFCLEVRNFDWHQLHSRDHAESSETRQSTIINTLVTSTTFRDLWMFRSLNARQLIFCYAVNVLNNYTNRRQL